MSTLTRILVPVLAAASLATPTPAQEFTADELRSLDGQVQEIKSDVLNIASELSNLEERLLYPSNTQLAVFVSIAEDEDFRLDAVQIEIDRALYMNEQMIRPNGNFKAFRDQLKGVIAEIAAIGRPVARSLAAE